ncbi:hypothetical protein NIES4073_21310 [Kalymmatonema gypsitolerans NIES-4073]|jgi:hypothetical protein|nr:hypothetical protein NIES4073_21310 [Scytonema sp. NIES-4073]
MKQVSPTKDERGFLFYTPTPFTPLYPYTHFQARQV